jgi:hypothetical protein
MTDERHRHVVTCGQFIRSCIARRMDSANGPYVAVHQLGVRRSLTFHLTTFGIAVCRVVLGRTKKQVIGIHTPHDVARMADTHAVRNRTDMQFVRNDMRSDSAAFVPDVAVSVAGSGEQPTRISFLDVLPELLCEWSRLVFTGARRRAVEARAIGSRPLNFLRANRADGGRLWGHWNLSFQCHAGGVCSTARHSYIPLIIPNRGDC